MVEWGNYAEAYKSIHDAIRSSLANAPEGKSITRLEFTYNADGNISTVVFKQLDETLFTLTFGYDVNKNLTSITRG